MSYTDSGGGTSDPNQGGYGGQGGNPIGDFFSNVGSSLGNLFGGGTGSPNLGSLASQAFAGSGSPQASAQTADALMSATDPTGSIAAQQSITGGQAPPQNQQNQSPQGPSQNQAQGQQQYAPQSAIDALKKALTGLAQRQRQNPYQLGTDGPNSGQPNASYLNRASRIPTGQVPPMPAQPAPSDSDQANQPSQYASAMEFANDNPPPPSPIDPHSATMAGLRGDDPDTGFRIPGQPANQNTPQTDFSDYLNQLRNRVTQPPPLDTGGPVSGGAGGGPGFIARNAPGSLGELVGRMLGPLGVYLGNTTPAETGELPQQTLGRKPSGPAQTQPQPGYRPEDDPRANPIYAPAVPPERPKDTKPGPKDPAKRKHPNLPADDPKNRVKLPTKKGPEGEYAPATGNARDKQYVPGPNRMMRDMSGVSTGVPPMLGQIAQMALPLLMSALGGGFGGRGGGFRMGRGFGHPGGFGGRNGFHPGGRNMWPYFHPQFGWRAHGGHPGQGWLPMSPQHGRDFGLNGQTSPLAFAGGGNQGDGGGQDQGGGGQDDTSPYNPYYDKGSRYRNPGEPSANVIGKGPNGQALPYTGQQAAEFTDQVAKGLGIDPTYARRILAGESSYGQNYTNPNDTDGYPSYGPFQLHMKPGAMGWRFQQATGENPADPSTWRDQIVFALKEAAKSGWGQWGAARAAGIPHMAGIPRGGNPGNFDWAYGKPGGGRTTTGGTASANPQGNPATVDTTPEYRQMGAEAGAEG